MLASQIFEDRRCHTCTKQKEWGCYGNATKPVYFDGETNYQCPLHHLRDNPRFYSEIFSLYGAREKGLYAEPGSYYDQPNAYNDIMAIMDGAVSDVSDEKQSREDRVKQEQERINKMFGG